MEIDPIAQGLAFLGLQTNKKSTTKQQKAIKGTKKTTFADSIKKAQQQEIFLQKGLPLELAGLTEDEALVFLKDNVDLAGEALQKDPSAENMTLYRASVGNFMKYIEMNAFEVIIKKRRGFNKKGNALDPVVQIRVINQKLERLSSDLVYNHKDNLNILKAVGEIAGLLVDLMAE